MSANRPVTNDKIYELVNSTRLELKGDIGNLRNQFETLESGRITRLEGKINDMEVQQIRRDGTLAQNQAVLSTKFMIIGGIGVMLLTGLGTALWNRILG